MIGQLAEFRRAFKGTLVLPDDPAYDAARRVWNGVVDRRPLAIAYCTSPQDVVEAVGLARSRGLPLAVRSGGHNAAGKSTCDDGLVIDLSGMKAITVDPVRRTARAEAGLSLGEFDAATLAHGLATTMGVNSDTGVAGLTLGGGFGRLGRKHGLACDNLLAAEVVLADGHIVQASPSRNADLFWGLRGGGGNFGIVTAFEFQLHALGPEILRASFTYGFGQARQAMRAYGAFCRTAPDEVSADAALARTASGEPVFGFSASYIGPVDEGRRVLEHLIGPLEAAAPPGARQIGAVPYLSLQSAADALFARGRRYYWKAHFLKELGDGAIDALVERFAAAPSPHSLFVFQQVGGAIARVPREATAYGHRDAAWDAFPLSIWDRPEEDEPNIAWGRDLWAALQPFSTGGVYVNNLGEEGPDRVRAAYGEAWPRLVALKDRYDPTNLFRLNQNVEPTPPAGGGARGLLSRDRPAELGSR